MIKDKDLKNYPWKEDKEDYLTTGELIQWAVISACLVGLILYSVFNAGA